MPRAPSAVLAAVLLSAAGCGDQPPDFTPDAARVAARCRGSAAQSGGTSGTRTARRRGRLRRGHRPGALRRGRRSRRRRRRPLRPRGRQRDRARAQRHRRRRDTAPAPAAAPRRAGQRRRTGLHGLLRPAPDRGGRAAPPARAARAASRSAARASAASRRTSSPAGDRLGQRVRLAGPEVEPVGVAALARRPAQRRRDVVDVGVAERRVGGVLALEAVDDAARGAAGERAREPGLAVAGDGLAVGAARSPTSGASMNAVPSWAAAAPAASTAATRARWRARRSRRAAAGSPPRRAAARRAGRGRPARCRRTCAVPARLDALDHERVGAAAPAARASSGVVTVTQTAQPAACRRATTARLGQPNVNDTTGTRSSATSASFSSQPSSSWRGAPTSARGARRARARSASTAAGRAPAAAARTG